MKMTIFGPTLEANVPQDFDSFFVDGVPVNRKYGFPCEMEVYSLYLGLRALEYRQDVNYSYLREKIVKRVLVRLEKCKGFWYHGAWTKSQKEIHLRHTSSAIRLLAEAYTDGLIDNEDVIVSSLHRHLSFSERLENGRIWFYHDSFESSLADSIYYARRELFNNHHVWGASTQNTLVLNTHVDTLITILHVLKSVDSMKSCDRQLFVNIMHAGLAALQYVLTPKNGLAHSIFQFIDSFVRKQIFSSYDDSHSSIIKAWRNLFSNYYSHRLYYSFLRPYLKVRFPFFQHRDGYLERAISLKGPAFNYHVVNTWDLARLAFQLESHDIEIDLAVKLREIARRGLEYAFSSSYFNFIKHSFQDRGFAIELCEALFTYFRREKLLSNQWIQRYVAIRRCLAPTPALLGYDPVIVDRFLSNEIKIIREFNLDPQSVDILILSEGKYLVINFSNSAIALPSDLSRKYNITWLSETPRKCTLTLDPRSAVLLKAFNRN